MVIEEGLAPGLQANTAAILGITLGKTLPEMVGADVVDKAGRRRPGITTCPIPILRATREGLAQLRRALWEYPELTVADFSSLAQKCRTYEEFTARMAAADELEYCGVALCGERKTVEHLTGSLPLLR